MRDVKPKVESGSIGCFLVKENPGSYLKSKGDGPIYISHLSLFA